MKKIIIVFAAVLTLIFSAVPTYAAENGNITGVYALKGKLFYYDTPTNKMVLTGLAPLYRMMKQRRLQKPPSTPNSGLLPPECF